MVELTSLVTYTNNFLEVDRFSDYCPNGLQVEGKKEINNLVCGVTASQALIDAAVDAKADALLVHHGFFWRGEAAPIVGMKKKRIQRLLEHDISLLAYHLPLDAHPVVGNNVQLAHLMNLSIQGAFGSEQPALGLYGQLASPRSGEEFAAQITNILDRKPLYIPGKSRDIQTLAWCTGAAQSYIDQAVELGVDAFLTGEVSESTVHIARETGIHFYSAGHHATEREGARALGGHLAEEFDIQVEFIDIPNPV